MLTIPWRQQAGLLVHGYFLLCTGVFVASLIGAIGLEGLLSGPFVLLYGYLLVNSTTVRVAPTGVQVSHGPFPSMWDHDAEVPAKKLTNLTVLQTTQFVRSRGVSHQVSHYSLKVGQTQLLRKFAEEEVVSYVAHVIQNTVEGPVVVRSM